jgi:hypothetical protein
LLLRAIYLLVFAALRVSAVISMQRLFSFERRIERLV